MSPASVPEEAQLVSLPQLTIWDRYVLSLQQRPVFTKASTSGVLNGLQELIAQRVAGNKDPKGTEKVVKMAAYGFLVSGPLGHYLYAAMEKAFAGKTGPAVGIMKLLVSNLVIAPIQNAVYIAAMALIAGTNTAGAIRAVRSRLAGVMKMTWSVFPLIQAFAFRSLPQPLWLPFFNLVAFVFGTYINTRTKLLANARKPSAP
ncbi:hypothetical protein HK097_007838 [Rhizophlyctis rosea]|uniref:Uncharacterized protein n=1 Tax=Rhizophlyctis rosea TaxID=64517 RepID=A0AAD5SB54_9FUNG|nr:hypothetical protein HK097_007838 [Rhizophlyctis rosea]